jgi:hypothetical protein
MTSACECFFVMLLSATDIGGRFAETVAGMMMADELGCTYLFDRDGFVRGDQHASEALQFLGIAFDAQLYVASDAREIVLDDWPWARQAPVCDGVRYRAASTQICRFGDNQYPTWCGVVADYDAVKWRLRERFYRVPHRRAVPAVERALTVAWHLRAGDIALDRAFYVTVAAELRRLAHSARTVLDLHFVFKAGASPSLLPSEYSFLEESVCGRNAQCTLHDDDAPVRSWRLLLSCDVLVTSRSLFSYVAALYARVPVLFEPPQPACGACFRTSEAFGVDARGRLVASADEFRARLGLAKKMQSRIRSNRGTP